MLVDGVIQLAKMMGIDNVKVHKTYVQMSCPFSSKLHEKATDRHPSLSVVLKLRSHWRCFACGQRGLMYGLAYQWATMFQKDPTPLLDLIDKQEDSVTVRCTILDEKYNEKWNRTAEARGIEWDVLDETELAPFACPPTEYILSRGLAPDTIKAFEIGFDSYFRETDTGKSQPRVTFPVRRRDGKLIGIVGRAIYDDAKEKYFNYWHFTKTNYLYGQNMVRQKWAILVEGMIDVNKLWEYGLPVVGTMGSLPSERQAQLLEEYERIYLALDRDKAGEEGTRWTIQRLNNRVPLFTVTFPDGKTDPKQMTQEEAWASIDQSKRVLACDTCGGLGRVRRIEVCGPCNGTGMVKPVSV